ncbi:MAG TPA: TIGR04552 family protein [Polyangiaceae bacterium]|nr:TIGR04552 family protein [Polyangiaceae bacterium]
MSAGQRGADFQHRLPNSLRGLDQFRPHDLEAVRLVLRGASVVDWHRLDFKDESEARTLLRNHELDLADPQDLAFSEHMKTEAIAYLRRHFSFSIPKPVEQANVLELMMMASGKGHRQLCACTILKTITIINHMTGRELLFRLPVSDKDVFHLVEEKVYRVVGAMLSGGFPVTEFIGGRKNLDSTYTKLLSKPEATASALYDKLRFRIVTRTPDDILPILLYLTEHLFPFNFIVPKESTNSLFDFRRYCEAHPHLSQMVHFFQGKPDEAIGAGDNRFSAENYRVIHFVTDVPVRVPDHITESAPPGCESLGPIVYVLCEFQMLDAETDANNEIGDASHDAYKRRQKEAVYRRLRLGVRATQAERSPAPPETQGADAFDDSGEQPLGTSGDEDE